MSLPITGNRTLATSQRVSRADVLAIQDCQVARYARGMQTVNRTITSALAGRGGTDPAHWPPAGYYREAAAGGHTLIVPVTIPVGRRVSLVYAVVYGGAGADITLALCRKQYGTNTAASVVTSVAGPAPTVWTVLQTTDTVWGPRIESGWRYYLRITAGQANDRCLYTYVASDRP